MNETGLTIEVAELRELAKRLRRKLARARAVPAKVELTTEVDRDTWTRIYFAALLTHGNGHVDHDAGLAIEAANAIEAAIEAAKEPQHGTD